MTKAAMGIPIEQHTVLGTVENNEIRLKKMIASPNFSKNKPSWKADRMRRKRKKNRSYGKHSPAKKNQNKDRRRKLFKKSNPGIRRHSCPTKTQYVLKTQGEDVFGDTVEIHPVIQIGKLTIDQFFYESFCDKEKCSCAGVNDDAFVSSCETTYSYTHARVIKNGEVGRSYIKVRSGCRCVVREKIVVGPSNILDILKK